MKVIDADKFLAYLIFSKHIDELTCGEVKKAIEMCKVDILDKIRTEIEKLEYLNIDDGSDGYDKYIEQYEVLKIIDKYKVESEEK